MADNGMAGKPSEEAERIVEDEAFAAEDQTLDLTGQQLKTLAGIPLPPSLTELDLTENRLTRLEPSVGALPCLRSLLVRQNLLTDEAVAEIAGFTALSTLQELVLRDNQLTRVPPLSGFPRLTHLELSYNALSSCAGLAAAPASLTELYLASNAVPRVEEVAHLTGLRLLELGSNKIRVMEGLSTLTRLEELWLGRNKVRQVDMSGLRSLVKISVQSNRLTSSRGFESCVLLQELYLSHNGISALEGLEPLTNLVVLDVSANRIARIGNLETLTKLEDLWLNDNQIESLDGIDASLAAQRDSLTTIYLERNPCASSPDYIPRLRAALPSLQQIDAVVLQRRSQC